MVARLSRSADFQRVLATSPWARSSHFAVHHLSDGPSLPAGRARKMAKITASTELSTGDTPGCALSVDESFAQTPARPPIRVPTDRWLGLVVPKRHAKRSVTRNLLKRQMRSVMAVLAESLPPGLWVLRLRASFDRKRYISPASDVLRRTVHDELASLLQRAASPR